MYKMREDTKRLRNEAREFDERVMKDKEPTVMPANYCVECGNFECSCTRTCKCGGEMGYRQMFASDEYAWFCNVPGCGGCEVE